MTRFSFVVPIYNAGRKLQDCIQSILNQNRLCEILLIDDGSTDESGKICDEAAAKHSNIRVFHTENQGPGAARNLGVKEAGGDYIVFTDSDDRVSDNLIEIASDYCDKNPCDVMLYPIVKQFPDGKCEPMGEGILPQKVNGKSAESVREHFSSLEKFPASSGGKIVRREFLNESNIAFHARRIGEDIDWTLQLIAAAKSFAYLIGCAYYYRISPNSRRSFSGDKSLADQLSILEEWYASHNDECVLSFLAYQYAVTFPFYGALSSRKQKLYYDRMKALKPLLRYGKTRKIRLIRLCAAVFGMKLTSKLLYCFVRFRDEIRHKRLPSWFD